ncbi:T9SS type A sorting domain-containing protein [Chondrinema litorale]|uniref:T9SS type A sorting domain-containing protein n=1 Tax=Chondrinema litorale TaxID=2994555 RepID=UPI0025432DE5|nr:T9SS type A sorting domain-containing protein [Chondrinema litorale]UZR99505.1 T9SS type A sorting domain-containing protein [Chondrinema litorale]
MLFTKSTVVLLIFVIIVYLPILSEAQKIESHYVVNAGAGRMENSSIHITYFIGDFISYESSVAQNNIIHLLSGEVQLYPNPVKSVLHIVSSLSNLSKIRVFDTNGKQVLDANLIEQQVDLGQLPRGMYLVKIMDQHDKIITSSKIIKS